MPCPPSFTLVLGRDGDLQDLKKTNQSRIQRKKRALILNAAESVFARHGFSGSRLKDIAEEAGLPKANILYYYKSKEDLYSVVCQDILKNWLGAIGEISVSSEPSEALRRYIEAKMELSMQRPNASRVFAMEIISGAPVIGDYLATELKSWVDNHVLIFQGWQKRGQLVDVSPYHVFFVIWAVTQTYADFETQIELVLGDQHLGSDEYRRSVKSATQIILRGLLPR
ncbi:TetR family transcriptional regulator C-terminal domain-containing protein [Alphaproteobacteria bacterium]|nr:TetR family transcriptional regulator C-terminal domain-containing protein [Alphaproteobacteria bacterium]